MAMNTKIEKKLYELLGVKQFRKLTFILEKVIHFKDKRKNINYHIKNLDLNSMEKFKKFLYYNGFIHARNSIFLTIITAIMMAFKVNIAMSITMLIFLIKDLYCVMLQRYNWIRLNEYQKRLEKRKSNINQKEIQIIKQNTLEQTMNNEKLDKEQLIEEIKEIKEKLNGKDNVILTDEYLSSFKLLEEIENEAKIKVRNRGK